MIVLQNVYAETSKVTHEIFQKGARFQLERFSFLHHVKFSMRMMKEVEVYLQLRLCLQLGILW